MTVTETARVLSEGQLSAIPLDRRWRQYRNGYRWVIVSGFYGPESRAVESFMRERRMDFLWEYVCNSPRGNNRIYCRSEQDLMLIRLLFDFVRYF
jgi:hypothetical protein